MFKTLKRTFGGLAKGEPGRRFKDHHERHGESESPQGATWKTVAYVGAGGTLLVAGLLLSLPPGVPGFLLWVPGLGLLAARFRLLARWLDRSELIIRRVLRIR
jgi:hypothetical protein